MARLAQLVMARISSHQLVQFTRRTGTSLQAGLDVVSVMEKEARRGGGAHQSQMEKVRRHVASGGSLTDALADCQDYFPPLVREMTRVAEATGKVDEIFLRLADHYQHNRRLRTAFLIGIAYPMLCLTFVLMGLGLFIYLLGVIVPDAPGLFGLSGASGAAIYFSVVFSVIALLGAIVVGVSRRWISLDPLIRVLTPIPGLGGALQTIALSRLTWALALAHDAGIDAKRTVNIAIRAAQNPYYTATSEEVELIVGRGGEMHEAFRSVNRYPHEVLDAIETGEDAGALSETLLELAKRLEERAKWWFRILTGVAVAGVFLIYIGLAIYMIIHIFTTMYLGPINDALEGL